jgi:uncharacterized membrane protein YhaH (DUF805 family)
MELFQLLLGFSGRINRAKYRQVVVIYIAAMAIVGAISFIAGWSVLVLLIAAIVCIPVVISGIAVGIKRLHNSDKSGWWLLVFYVVPGVLSSLAEKIGPFLVRQLTRLALSIWAVVERGFLRGTSGPNTYGPDPLAS